MRMNDLEQMAIERLKAASDMSLMAYQQPLVICISGGKDSGVIRQVWRIFNEQGENVRMFQAGEAELHTAQVGEGAAGK